MKNLPKIIFLQVGNLEDGIEDFSVLHEVTWSDKRIFETDVEYILKPSKEKKSVNKMAKEANGRSRACAKCTKMFMCNSIDMAICSDAFIEGYKKGYKQGRKG